MGDLHEEQRVFGFTPDDWIRSGAFTAEHFERILGSMALGEHITFTTNAWMALARLGPEYAQPVWDRLGEHWIARLALFRERAPLNPPGLGGPEAFDRVRRYCTKNIRELRRLAGLEELELPE